MTLFSHPVFSVLNSYTSQEITAEFFFYARSLNQEFVVYLRQNDYDPYLIFDFYRYNGEYVFTKTQSIPGVKKGEYDKIIVRISPNGKYLFFKEQFDAPMYEGSMTYQDSQFQRTHTERYMESALEQTELHEGGSVSHSCYPLFPYSFMLT